MSSDMWRYLLHNPQMEELVTAVKAIAPRLPVYPTKSLDLQPCIDKINQDNIDYVVLISKSPKLISPDIIQYTDQNGNPIHSFDLFWLVIFTFILLISLLFMKSKYNYLKG